MILWERLVGAGCTDSINYNIRTIFLNILETMLGNRKKKESSFLLKKQQKSGASNMIWQSFFSQE